MRQIPTLEAAAIRTLIMLKAEWREDMEGAVTLAELTVAEFQRDEDAFLVVEVTGRQLFYNGRVNEAEAWLERARHYPIAQHPLWRRNVLITLAEIRGKSSPPEAVLLVREAVEVARKDLEPERLAEAYAEEAIASWNQGHKEASFDSLSRAIHTILSIDTGSVTWKQCFAGLFQMAFYYSSRVCNITIPDWVSEPALGAFLGLESFNISAVNASQKVIIQVRMSMFAEGIGATEYAGTWFDDALSLLGDVEEARSIRLFAGLGIAPALLAGELGKVIRLGLMLADAEGKSALALEHMQQLPDANKQVIQDIATTIHAVQTPLAFLRFMAPIAAHLAIAKLIGLRAEEEKQMMEQIASALQNRLERTQMISALQTAILEETDWESLHKIASTLVPQIETTAVGIIYMIGAALKAPISVSFGLHVWLARNIEKLFRDLPSLQCKVFYPFFETYWMKAVDTQTHGFRTAPGYTRKSILAARSGEPALWGRVLLRNIAFCLYGSVPQQIRAWLNSDDVDFPI